MADPSGDEPTPAQRLVLVVIAFVAVALLVALVVLAAAFLLSR